MRYRRRPRVDLLEDDPELWCGILTRTPEIFSAGTGLSRGAGEPTPRGGEYGVVRRDDPHGGPAGDGRPYRVFG